MTQRGRGRPPHPGILTAAEERVLEELRRGGTNAEIAARLGVTLDAVKFHISNMLGKLELDSRHQLAAWRPEPRRRLFELLAVPGTLEPIGRLLVWAGVAAAGAAAAAVVAVVLIVLSSLGRQRAAARAGADGDRHADSHASSGGLGGAGSGRAGRALQRHGRRELADQHALADRPTDRRLARRHH